MELTESGCNEHHHDGASVDHRTASSNPFTMQPLCILDTADTGPKTTDNTGLQRRSVGGAMVSRKTQQSRTVPTSTNCRRLLHHQHSTGADKCSLLSLLWSLLELEWTLDVEKTAWCGWNRPSGDTMVVKPLCFI